LDGALLLLPFFDQGQKPTNQQNQKGYDDENMQHAIEQVSKPLLVRFIVLPVTRSHSRSLPP